MSEAEGELHTTRAAAEVTSEDWDDFWHSEDEPSDFTPTVRKLFPELDPNLIHDAQIGTP
jgi:hypothetical protein